MRFKKEISALIFLLTSTSLFAGNNIVPGTHSSPYPTLLNISLIWEFSGDDNSNSSVKVIYRKKGENQFKEAMNLRRVDAGSNEGFSWDSYFAGSIFDLTPGTTYEVALELLDPDGGSESRALSVKTRDIVTIPDSAEIIDLPSGNHDVLTVENGTESAPKVYRSLDGSAIYDFVDLNGKEWVYIWGVTVKSSGNNGTKGIKMNGAKNCVIRYCNIEATFGIVAYGSGISNCYIADNTITGTTGWSNETMGAQGNNIGEGIQFTGPGNIICYNKVVGFRDCISTMEDSEAKTQQSIDIYNNDLDIGADDGIEADFCMSNCRIIRNRLTNCYVALSSQPALGGPVYFIRNDMYNAIHAAFKFKRFSQGNVTLHNTVVKIGAGLSGNNEMDYAYYRNNLAFGGPNGGINWGGYGAGKPWGADIPDPGTNSSFDYDAVGVVNTPYIAKIGGVDFSNVEEHGIADIDYTETFGSIPYPEDPVPAWDTVSLIPQPTSAVIDKGLVINNVNDIYSGSAPDIGAYEIGQPIPHYGPRPVGVNEGDNPLTSIFNHDELPNKNSLVKTVFKSGKLHISFLNSSSAQHNLISVFNLKGQKIFTQKTNKSMTINLNRYLSKGCYLLKINLANEIFSEIINLY